MSGSARTGKRRKKEARSSGGLVSPSHQPRRHRKSTACAGDDAAGELDGGAKSAVRSPVEVEQRVRRAEARHHEQQLHREDATDGSRPDALCKVNLLAPGFLEGVPLGNHRALRLFELIAFGDLRGAFGDDRLRHEAIEVGTERNAAIVGERCSEPAGV